MIARLFVLLPFSVIIPNGEEFPLFQYSENGYDIIFYPPIKSGIEETSDVDEIKINDQLAFKANVLRVDFQKDNFKRSQNSPCDPSEVLINKVINSFIVKLRFVTRSSKIKPINFPFCSWKIKYLNDDESELTSQKGFFRGRGSVSFSFTYTALNKEIWKDIHELPDNYCPPQWDTILLDADAAFPDIGSSIVLAFTALEVFISYILDKLADKSNISPILWEWINQREWLRKPSTEEQFDKLMKILLEVSLKENEKLWEAFKNLKNARNTFVHEGIARIGSNEVSTNDVLNLLIKVKEIINYIKGKLPEELKWPEYKYSLNVEGSKTIF